MEETKKYGRLTKELMFSELKSLFDKNEHIFIIGNKKLKTEETKSLRRLLQQTVARYVVVKNTLCYQALKEKSLKPPLDFIQGQTALVFGSGDPVIIAKTIVGFAKEHEAFKIKGAFLAGEQVNSANVDILAHLPSRDVLIARAVGGIKAPITRLVLSLSGLLRQLVIALDRVRQKKS